MLYASDSDSYDLLVPIMRKKLERLPFIFDTLKVLYAIIFSFESCNTIYNVA